ncbi:MAG TPA: neutral/alkaline non-lysosomal ceramidase N-terminal domain-containing protein [Mycobacteriales bacterium]|nr:neutral/alkaline non-lysosomal ceramidase N-terminal domain-containing protein [Mycobacteriales bacterium]
MDAEAAPYLVGRGISDVTGELWGCGLLGYGKADQVSKGLHTRLRTRAFVFVDPSTDERVLICVSDLPLMFDSVHREVLRRLAASYGESYTDNNTMLTVTHTHCGPGGYSHHRLYNMTTHGFHPLTFGAIVDGIVEAVDRAHADIAPATLTLSRGTLDNASVNRSPQSFARNPESDKAHFPQGVDPQTTLLRVERDGRVVGAINWFATHGTSMTNRNCLVSADNKGYAAYHWERLVSGVDYLAGPAPDFISAFAQTNAGDMSPNLNRRPGSGPTEDEFENTRIIGQRQADAAAELARAEGVAVTGGLDARLTYVDLGNVTVSPEFTGDGRSHRTTPVMGGAAALAGTDEGPGFPGFKQGRNRIIDALSRATYYRFSSRLRDGQAPKGIVLPGGVMNRIAPFVQERVPVQLLRIGRLYLIGIPGEVTITAGLRMRREVASVVGADLADVLVAGYSNAYIHYVTTPEEYAEQRYEGGSTLFGRWEAPALTQIAVQLATAMRDKVAIGRGTPPPDLSHRNRRPVKRKADRKSSGRPFGDVLSAPRGRYSRGEMVEVAFAGANLNNDLHRGGTFLEVERAVDGSWQRVADDGDWTTKLHCSRAEGGTRITITWDVPADAADGEYRIRYHGDACDAGGRLSAFTGTSPTFTVA